MDSTASPMDDNITVSSDDGINSSLFSSVFQNSAVFTTPFPERRPHGDFLHRHPTLAQPLPSWDEARELFGWAWEVHIYGLGSAFAVLALYCLICVLQLCRHSTTRAVRCYFILLHVILCCFGVSRAVFLLLDPYNFRRILPQSLAAACLHLSFPCITSAFSMVLAGLVRTARLKLMKSRIMNVYLLIGILIGNFAFAIGAEVAVDLMPRLSVFAVASQTYFIAWSIGLGCGFLVMFSPLLEAAQDADGIELSATKRITLGVYITLVSAVLLLVFAGLHIYGLVAVYRFLIPADGGDYDAWRWYGFHSGTRLAELLLSASLAFVASLTVWTRAARKLSSVQVRRTVSSGTAGPGMTMEADRLLMLQQGRNTPSSPARNRRDFPVTFNPEGVRADEEFFPGRFPNRARKPVSQLLEGNPIHHHVDEGDRYG
ncbi:hypothetical protein BV898_02585 [Hypsibius exemplaris]|uniref:Proline-rich transmembrane protein 3/4 domain-containing protein n=1 Tax=Hypsibius exemplaris TaxID=2072580 RepID=A0A1W0X7G4_HYPEX|nr:hypothetical protein BV898_02585 [Hypsibius exemplaris]